MVQTVPLVAKSGMSHHVCNTLLHMTGPGRGCATDTPYCMVDCSVSPSEPFLPKDILLYA
jgi:hypothetical protein